MLDPVSLKLDPEGLDQPGLCTYTRPGSVAKYSSDLRRHLIGAFGARQLNELTRWDVQAFLTGKLKLGYAGAHVHGMRTKLSKVLQAAVEWGFIETNPARVLEPTRKSVGLQHVSWHTFRYTQTRWLSEAGVSPRVAQSILGHSDVTLNVYTQVVPESQKLAMEKVAAILGTSGDRSGTETGIAARPD